MGDRANYPAYGLFGGKPGALGTTLLNPSTSTESVLSSKGTYRLGIDDMISWRTCGAGGTGDPFTREPKLVLDDVLDGFESIKAAASEYGVSIDPTNRSIDEAKTKQLRDQ